MLKINSKTPLLALVVSLLFVSCSSKKINQEMLTNYIVDSTSEECIVCRASELPKSKNTDKKRWSTRL